MDKVVADGADIADALQILPILEYAHLAAHASLLHDLIEDLSAADAVLGLSLSVNREHDCNGTLLRLGLRNPRVCQRASDETRLRWDIRSCLSLRDFCRRFN